MNNKIDWQFLFNDTRARIYLLWAVLCIVGFSAAHFSRNDLGMNSFWVILSAVGLGYMYKVMYLKMTAARRVLLAWLVPITVGMIVSFLAFYLPVLTGLAPYLGAFWLLVLALSFLLNGIYDPPSKWYWIAVALHVGAAVLIIFSSQFQAVQWLVAAIVSGWSMLNLWLFRS